MGFDENASRQALMFSNNNLEEEVVKLAENISSKSKKIVKIGKNLGKAKNVIEEKNLCISDGWVDLFSVIREPGNEHQDNIENLLKSAAKGGFTSVLGVSGTTPPLDNKSQIKFVRNSSTNSIVNLLPAGTITENQEGKEITEMYDMHLAGAAAFTDGKKVINIENVKLEKVENEQR